jgi:transcription initiation factor IIE alpha subunit
MPSSTCFKCGNQSFELTYLTSIDSKITVQVVQCESCGSVVGALDDFGASLSEIDKTLKAIEEKLRVEN